MSVGEAFEYAKTKVIASYQKAGTILTEHATLDDSREGKFAATLFLESDRARAAKTANVANPELRALLEAQQQLENQVTALRLKKDVMPAAEYDQQIEKLLTELALEGPRHPGPRGGRRRRSMRIAKRLGLAAPALAVRRDGGVRRSASSSATSRATSRR